MDNQTLGKYGEKIASRYLQKQGYKVIEINFRQRYGEIDIVAVEPRGSMGQDVLVFVEVKTRMIFDTITPEQSVTPWKVRSLKKTAFFYKKLHPELPDLLRIDFVGVVLGENMQVERINLIKNITE